jgi:hypothetical protein
MTDKRAEHLRLTWREPLYGIVAAIVVFIPLVMDLNTDVLYTFIIAPILLILGLGVLLYAAIRKHLQVAVMLVTFWTVSGLLFIYAPEVHSTAKWLLSSSEYKKEVLAQPVPSNGDFKHLEWDGWGWAGINNSEYLVFDPTDSLSAAAKSRQAGRFNGVPCAVPLIRRFESHWYKVRFYTDQDWSGCSFEADKLISPKTSPPAR